MEWSKLELIIVRRLLNYRDLFAAQKNYGIRALLRLVIHCTYLRGVVAPIRAFNVILMIELSDVFVI